MESAIRCSRYIYIIQADMCLKEIIIQVPSYSIFLLVHISQWHFYNVLFSTKSRLQKAGTSVECVDLIITHSYARLNELRTKTGGPSHDLRARRGSPARYVTALLITAVAQKLRNSKHLRKSPCTGKVIHTVNAFPPTFLYLQPLVRLTITNDGEKSITHLPSAL